MVEGYAKVWDSNKMIYNKPDKLIKRRKLTKEQFTEEWNKVDEKERIKLIATTIPIVKD